MQTKQRQLDDSQSQILTVPNGVVRITALDANHCPGSCMFLLERFRSYICTKEDLISAVLYTGDIRAEPSWCDSVRSSLPLQPYLVGHDGTAPMRTLDNIYLDTSAALDTSELLPNVRDYSLVRPPTPV